MAFVKKSGQQEPGFNIKLTLGNKETKGDVGIEIEVEGNTFPKPEGMHGAHSPVKMPGLPAWSYVHDGSLRGDDNAEYLLTKPIEFSAVPKAVRDLFVALNKHGSVIQDSNRTSVHVHLNCQEFHLNRLTSLMALYFVFEEILVEWCGEHRVGNLFCLRAVDAPAIVSMMKTFIKSDGKQKLYDGLHYAGLNTSALHKYGSLEFRTLQGCSEPNVIIDWVAILQRLYELSEEFNDPRDICGMFSANGPLAFFDIVLGEKGSILRKGTGITDERIRDCMYSGIRLAQDLCYCRDWGTFNPVSVREDPFGRDSKKIMQSMTTPGMPPYLQEEPVYDEEPELPPMPPTANPAGIPNFNWGDPFGQLNSTWSPS